MINFKLQEKLAKAKIIQNINKAIIEQYNYEEINLDYTADYNEEGLDVIIRKKGKDTGKDIPISQKILNEAIENLATYTKEQNEELKELEKSPRPYTQETNSKIEELQKIKHDLVRIIFITSEAMRFQCDEKSLEMYANFKNDKELTADEIKDLNKEKNKIEKEKTQLKTQLKNSIEKNVAKKSNIIQLILKTIIENKQLMKLIILN